MRLKRKDEAKDPSRNISERDVVFADLGPDGVVTIIV